jgi:hypothetical protein
MPAVTAVELGPDACVLVGASLHRADVRVLAVDILNPAAFPGTDAFVAALTQSRRKLKLPRRARVVLWGLPDGATPRDPPVRTLLTPLASAGFRIQRVVSPSNALAALARIRTPRPDGAVGWLAVDRAGVAMVVARPGELLYSHTFKWDSSVGASGSQARMLQRYSLVAYLAPELRRAIAAAREKGARVDTIITCGNLPDLRSLTMPLIEELDLEVETLDSLDGLTVKPEMRDRLIELAPAIRMACAGAATRATRLAGAARPANTGGLFRAAALLAAAGGIGWFWYSQRGHRQGEFQVATVNQPAPQSSSGRRPTPAPHPAPGRPSASAAETASPASSRPGPVPPAQTSATRSEATAAPKGPATSSPSGTEKTIGVRPQAQQGLPRTGAGSPGSLGPPRTTVTQPSLLADPLPQISTILVSEDRRFAMIDGRVVTVGDHVGQRVVTAIEPRAVVLREPSGVQIRVGLGGRFIGIKAR